MPTLNNMVKFAAGLYASYVALETKDPDKIYFCTDNGRIFLGEQEYSRPVLHGAGAPASTIAKDNPKDTLYWDTTNKKLYITVDSGDWVEAKVSNADHAAEADHATTADNATNAGHATSADSATEATHAASADNATNAGHATTAGTAEEAAHATNADNATNAVNAQEASHAADADHADTADEATHATSADQATRASAADEADKVKGKLTLKSKQGSSTVTTVEYNGSADLEVEIDEAIPVLEGQGDPNSAVSSGWKDLNTGEFIGADYSFKPGQIYVQLAGKTDYYSNIWIYTGSSWKSIDAAQAVQAIENKWFIVEDNTEALEALLVRYNPDTGEYYDSDSGYTYWGDNIRDIVDDLISKGYVPSVEVIKGDITGLKTDVGVLKEQIVGLTGAMHFRGSVEKDPTETTPTLEPAPAAGDVVVFGTKEYVYDGTAWKLLGDEGSYLLKTEAESNYLKKTDATATYQTIEQAGKDHQALSKEIDDDVAAEAKLRSDADTALDVKIGQEIDNRAKAIKTAKEALVGDSDDTRDDLTIYGARAYASYIAGEVASSTLEQAKDYADQSEADAVSTATGTASDTKDKLTIHGTRAYAAELSGNAYNNAVSAVTGDADKDTKDSNTIHGAKKYAEDLAANAVNSAKTVWESF